MVYKIFATKEFEDVIRKLSSFEKARVEKSKEQMKVNPFSGRPLGYRFFREKKLGGKRLYFLIYVEKSVVLLIDYSGKKNQQVSVDKIKESLELFKGIIDDFS